MNLIEYNKVKNFSYKQYCNYLKEKYGESKYNYFPNGNRRSQEGLFLHHIGEIEIASLSNKDIAKANEPKYQEPEYLCYCDYLEHALLHIMIGEETAGSRNLGLHGDNLFIIPAMRSFFEEGIKQNNYNDAYYNRIKNDKDVYNLIWQRYNDTVEKADIVIDYNKVLYLQMEEALEKHNKALVVLGTGLGKTTTALQYLWKHQCRALVICPNNLIKNGWEAYGDWVETITYQSFANEYKDTDYSQYGLVILDEAHHIGYDEESNKGAEIWSKGIRYILKHNIKVLGLTATPDRNDGVKLGRTLFKDCVCEGLAVEDAIEKHIIHPFSYVTAIYDTNKLVQEVKDKYYSEDEECKKLFGQLDLAINNTITMRQLFTKYLGKFPNTLRKGIIFIQEIADKEYVLDIFKQIFPKLNNENKFRCIDSKMNLEEVETNRKWFEETDEGYLIAINMISEGAHYKGVNTLIMFRRTQSYLVYTQQLGRIITLIKDENPNAIVFDLVNNVENIRYNDRKLNKRKKEEHSIDKIRRALENLKSEQIIIADETRNIVDCIRTIKNKYGYAVFNEYEDSIIKENWYSNKKKIYKLIPDKTEQQIFHRAKYVLNLEVRKRNEWTDLELNQMKQLYEDNGPDYMYELFKGTHSRNLIMNKARSLNLKYDSYSYAHLTDEEKQIVKANYVKGGIKLCREFLNNKYSDVAITKVAKEFNLYYKQITKEQEEIVINNVNNKTRSELACMSALSEFQVLNILKKYNLDNISKSPRSLKWTEEEDNIIKTYYSIEGKEIINRLPNRTYSSIMARASKLKIKAPKNSPKNKL